MKLNDLKMVRFIQERNNYSYERQILAVALFYYAIVGVVSYIALFYFNSYTYTWPLWGVIIVISLILMEATLRIQNIKLIRDLVLVISTFFLAPFGLYISGSITTPSSIYILIVLINICLLSNGTQRTFYISSLLTITVSFMAIENHFSPLLFFTPIYKNNNLRPWNGLYIALAWVIYRQISCVTNILSAQRQNLTLNNENLTLSNDDLEREGNIDGLTHLFNKKYLMQILEVALANLRRQNTSLGVLLIDIDDFKAFNDHYGHMEGDICLKEVANTIKDSLRREGDMAFRFGGEEFVIVVSAIDLEGIKAIAQRILDCLKTKNIPHEYCSSSKHVSVSIGISLYNQGHANLSQEVLLEYPDKAMYEAKKLGKNRYTVFESLSSAQGA